MIHLFVCLGYCFQSTTSFPFYEEELTTVFFYCSFCFIYLSFVIAVLCKILSNNVLDYNFYSFSCAYSKWVYDNEFFNVFRHFSVRCWRFERKKLHLFELNLSARRNLIWGLKVCIDQSFTWPAFKYWHRTEISEFEAELRFTEILKIEINVLETCPNDAILQTMSLRT